MLEDGNLARSCIGRTQLQVGIATRRVWLVIFQATQVLLTRRTENTFVGVLLIYALSARIRCLCIWVNN